MTEIGIEVIIAGIRPIVFEVLELNAGDGPQRRVFKLQIAAWVLDHAGVLPRPGIAMLLGKTDSWVSYSIAATERRAAAHHGFRLHADKMVQALTAALTGPQIRRV